MTRFLTLAFTVLGFCSAWTSFAGDEEKYIGTWHNQVGSEMIVSVDGTGRISGKYHTAVGRKEVTQPDVWFDITGVVNGDVVGFVVSWGPTSGAISAWSGHYVSAGKNGNSTPEIRTLTHTGLKITEMDPWKRIIAGNDVFKPGPSSLSLQRP